MTTEMENRVGFWPRAAAYLLDLAVLWTLGLALQRPLTALVPGAVAAVIQEALSRPESELARPGLEWAARVGVATTLLAPFYYLIETYRGWTPGKLVLGLRVVGEDGQPAPRTSLLMRYGIHSAAVLIGFVALLSGLRALNVLAQATGWATTVGCLLVFGKARMAIHDRIAGTAVLRKGDVVVRAARAGRAMS